MNQRMPEDLSEEIRVAFLAAAKHPPYLVGEESAEALVEFFKTHPPSTAVARLLVQAIQERILLFAKFAAIYGMLGVDLSEPPPPTPFMEKLTELDESDPSR